MQQQPLQNGRAKDVAAGEQRADLDLCPRADGVHWNLESACDLAVLVRHQPDELGVKL